MIVKAMKTLFALMRLVPSDYCCPRCAHPQVGPWGWRL